MASKRIDIAKKWKDGLHFEIQFWERVIDVQGRPWHDDYMARLNPSTPFNPVVEEQFRFPIGQEVEVLDVGAGPITSLGYKSNLFQINLTAVDALADVYADLLSRAQVIPPVKTQKCLA